MIVRASRNGGAGRRASRRSGLATLELAMVLPMFLGLLMGVWEIARMVELKRVLQSAAREGARQASTGSLTNTEVVAAVKLFLKVSLNDADATGTRGTNAANNSTVTVSNVTSPGVDAASANQLDQLKVDVSINYNTVSWMTTNFFTSPSTVVSADCYQLCVKDKDFPSTSTPPIE